MSAYYPHLAILCQSFEARQTAFMSRAMSIASIFNFLTQAISVSLCSVLLALARNALNATILSLRNNHELADLSKKHCRHTDFLN